MTNQCILILCLMCITEFNPASLWIQMAPLHCSQPRLFHMKTENSGWPHGSTWVMDCKKLNVFTCSHGSNIMEVNRRKSNNSTMEINLMLYTQKATGKCKCAVMSWLEMRLLCLSFPICKWSWSTDFLGVQKVLYPV